MPYIECPRCGEDILSDDDYCEICGWEVETTSYKTSKILSDIEQYLISNTLCNIKCLKYTSLNGEYTIAQLQIDSIPQYLKKGQINFAMMFKPTSYCVFKREECRYLMYENATIILDLTHYDSFIKDGYNIFFDKRHFSDIDLIMLKLLDYDKL